MKNTMSAETGSMRINKFLAHAGVCSRRDADKLIDEGKVLVNGEIPTPGQQIGPRDKIMVNGRRIQMEEQKVVLAFYKPVGVTCTEKDEHAEKTIMDCIQYPIRVTYAGRLDKDSEGVMLLTNDGDLIQGMMKGANGHEKEYIVRTDKKITPEFLQKMAKGVYLKDLKVKTRECRLEKIGDDTFKIVLTQGLNRQIRRMCQTFGFYVKSIKRIRVMHVTLGSLKPGEYRELAPEEVQKLYKACGIVREK